MLFADKFSAIPSIIPLAFYRHYLSYVNLKEIFSSFKIDTTCVLVKICFLKKYRYTKQLINIPLKRFRPSFDEFDSDTI